MEIVCDAWEKNKNKKIKKKRKQFLIVFFIDFVSEQYSVLLSICSLAKFFYQISEATGELFSTISPN
jgi:hypothetical protein